MQGLERATGEQVAAYAEHVARLKHDLGKYIAFRTNWLPEDASPEARRAALMSDLHHTRRGPDGSVDAQTVWREFRAVLVGEAELAGLRTTAPDPRVVALDRTMERLAALEPLAAAGASEVELAISLAREVADGIRELARELREMVLTGRSA